MIIRYLLMADMDEAPLEKLYLEGQYKNALRHICSWLNDPEVFNVRFFYLCYDEECTFISAISIKVTHVPHKRMKHRFVS